MRRSMTLGAFVLTLAVGGISAAQTGSAQLGGTSVLAVHGCGRDRAAFAAVVAVQDGGTWSATDSEGSPFTGTWTPKGRSGRALDLRFDASTETAFVAVMVSDIAALCDTIGPITVTSVVVKSFKLSVNRKHTRATLVLRYLVRGTAEGRAGTAQYRVKAKGPWTAPALTTAGAAATG